MSDARTDALVSALLVIAGLDRPEAQRELWVPRDRVEYDHGPEVVSELIDELKLVVEWVHPDGPQLVLTALGAARLGVVPDERIDLVGVSDVDDEGRAVRYDVIMKRDIWVKPPEDPDKPWPFRLPRRVAMHPIPNPLLVADGRAGPLEELICLEAWSERLNRPLAVDPSTGMMVDPSEEGRPVKILGSPVQVSGPRRVV